ncbi:F-box domain cyclin-containing protein [Lasiodiplodia theobromae]|uniref:F-box domain cyclin-containing protein n=1 Tax=Lasiodiplodia theobromae TaxID=45133 RepID=UPI0015C36F41|nr:F-box domain cyclin-containing protein [Lasiodiplodia theobromae]KAF4535191.1 F-box domain cyclin-containing protein [Lasiodiplodia theobromae]
MSSTSIPPSITWSKWYYREHVQDINREFEEVRALGPAAGEEWFKGLDDIGRGKIADAERWERWERKGGFHDLSPPRRQTVSPPTIASSSQQPPTAATYAQARQLPMNGVPRAVSSYSSQYPGTTAEQSMAPQSLSPGASNPLRPERSIRDANEAKAARKNEIERRCQELNPPISPNVLRHMKAFQAACQISSPLTEKAWEMLKPRLEAQRDEAEKVEHERAAQMAALQVKLEDRRQQDASMKEVREVLEREWEEVQRPVREKLARYADEITSRDWMDGRSLSKDNCPQFAADLLIEIRSRFYADLALEDEDTLAAGQEIREDPPTGPPTRRLLLENMKWVFDNKIKPLTEQFRKELFLCNGEGCEGNPKWYGFEGIIQHYGAKHTTAFSVGNVVVCWKEAEWPEEHPFHPDPSKARYGFYNGYPSSSMAAQPQHAYPTYPYGGYPQGTTSMPPTTARTPHPFVTQSSPGPYGQYGATNGPFPPPAATSANFYGPRHGPPQPYGPPPGSMPPYVGSSQAQWHDSPYSYDGYAQFPPPHGPTFAPPGNNFGPPMPGYGDTAQGQFGPQPAAPGPYGPYRGGSSSHGTPPAPPAPDSRGPLPTNVYREQLQVLTDVARDYWTSTSGVKGLPPSVRLSVVIYHILYHFNLRFGIEPSLDLFADALDSHNSMHPLNAVAGLRCRACIVPDEPVENETSAAHQPRDNSPARRRFTGDHAEHRQEQRQEPTPTPRSRPARLSGPSFEGSPMARSPMAPPTAPPSGDGEYDSRRPPFELDEHRASRRPMEYPYSPPRGDRRMRAVYYDEPRYYVARDYDDHGYPSRRSDNYVPLSPAASRRYSYYGRVYEESLDRPRREERHASERDVEAHERVPTRAGLRYIDRPELSAAPSPSNAVRPESRQRNEENADDNSVKQEPRSPMPPDVEAAADRFLDDLATGERVREYVSRAARDEDEMENAENRTRQHSRAPNEAPARSDDAADGQGSQTNSVRGNGFEHTPRGGRSTAEPEPEMRRYSHGLRYPRDEDYGSLRRRESESRRYTYAPSRYRRVSMYHDEPYHYGHRIVRSRSSRYGRYEAARRQLEQSKSPTREGTSVPEQRQRSERHSPEPPMYDARYEPHYPSHAPSRDYVPYEDRERYSPGPPPGYRYAEAPPPPSYVNEYGEVIEYVRIHDPYHDHRYVQGPPPDGHGRYVEYLPYERQRRYEPVHDDRHYVYYPERRPYYGDHEAHPYYPGREGRDYEVGSSVPPPQPPPGPPPREREEERRRESAFAEDAA